MTTENPLNRDPITQEPGAHPVGTSLGAGGGALAGAAIGTLAAGPIGTIAGGMIGAITGGMAGKEIAEATNPTVGGDHEDNLVGQGVGASAGVMAGAAIGSTVGPIGTVVGAGIGAAIGGVAGNSVEEMISDDDDKTLNQNHSGIHSTRPIPTTATVTTTQKVEHNEIKNMSSTDLDNMHKTELHRIPESAMTDHSSPLASGHTTASQQSAQSPYDTQRGNSQSLNSQIHNNHIDSAQSGLNTRSNSQSDINSIGNSQYGGYNSLDTTNSLGSSQSGINSGANPSYTGNSQSASSQYPVGSQSSSSINKSGGSLSNPEGVDPTTTLGQTVSKHSIYKDNI